MQVKVHSEVKFLSSLLSEKASLSQGCACTFTKHLVAKMAEQLRVSRWGNFTTSWKVKKDVRIIAKYWVRPDFGRINSGHYSGTL